jgi:hypothetical protein
LVEDLDARAGIADRVDEALFSGVRRRVRHMYMDLLLVNLLDGR